MCSLYLEENGGRSPGGVGGSDSGGRLRVKPWVPKVRNASFQAPRERLL